MKLTALLSASLLAATASVAAPHPAVQHTAYGSIDRHYIYSPSLTDTVTVDVWTPAGYDPARTQKYPVIYMHDGQNLFDATTTWNAQAWEMDSVTQSLIDRGAIQAPVIVGVHSVAETRVGDLAPQKPVADMLASLGDGAAADSLKFHGINVRGDAYARFVATTLRQFIDSAYNVSRSPESTSVMGSSMGGLMSVYLLCEYPEIFGSAACLSTHWIGTTDGKPHFTDAMIRYLKKHLPCDGRHRLYLDRGTETLDALYQQAEPRVIEAIESMECFRTPGSFATYLDKGGAHEERSWMRRVDRPLRFLLPR